MRQQLLLQGASGLYEEAAIDGRVTLDYSYRLIDVLQPPDNLLRRPQQLELACHDVRQRSVLRQFTDLGTTRPIPGSPASLTRPIASLATVALDLAADSRGGSPELRGKANGSSDPQPPLAKFLLVRSVSAPIWSGTVVPDVSHLSLPESVLSMSGFDQTTGHLLERITFPPALPHQRFLAFSEIDPRSSFHLQHSLCLRSL